MSDLNVLYRFFDAAEQLLYVGITMNPSERFAKHRGDKSWWNEIARIAIEHYADRERLLAAERSAIQAEHPLHNIVLNGRRARLPEPVSIDPFDLHGFAGGQRRRGAYAFGLRDGECPIGALVDASEGRLHIQLYRWMIGEFDGDSMWVNLDDVVLCLKAHDLSRHEKLARGYAATQDVVDMDPLGEFQTRWVESRRSQMQFNPT